MSWHALVTVLEASLNISQYAKSGKIVQQQYRSSYSQVVDPPVLLSLVRR